MSIILWSIRHQCLHFKLCKTPWAAIELSLRRQEGYLRNFIGHSEVLFRWGGPRRLWWQTGFAELCHGIRQRGLPWETENYLSLSSEQFWFLRLQDKNNPQRMFNNARINHLTPQHYWEDLVQIHCVRGWRVSCRLSISSTYCWNTIDKEDVTLWGGHHCVTMYYLWSSPVGLWRAFAGHVTG